MAPPPDTRLLPPVPAQPLPDVLTEAVGFTQYISPSYWVGVIIDQLFGTDPFQWVAEEFTGDWRAVATAGAALKNLGSFNADMSATVGETATVTMSDWQGNAASAANQYFSGFADAVDAQQRDLVQAGEQFEQIAFGMNRWTATVRGLLLTLSDFIVAAALAAAATAATGVTGVGAILGAAATAAAITKVLGVWGEILTLHGYVVNAVNAMLALAAGYGSSLRHIEHHALPAASYDNLSVA